ncbi:hypothetical protein HK104_008291 [Borealophlyctis nickersoniae]|nr:hypothetical protein HK104_008291 [Borealophlyctis nickersoniae]
MAYDCLFGVAGRIDVLRQPTFTSFLLSLVGSAGFGMGVRAVEAVHFRRKTMKAVEDAADWKLKSRISLHVPDDDIREVFNSAESLETGQSLVKHPSELDLGIAEKPLKPDIVPRIMSVLPKRTDVEPLGAAEKVLIEKPRTVVPVYVPKVAAQPTTANIMSVSVLVKLWGAHRLAETAADAIFRLQSFFVMAFFISLAPESRHACFGYVDYDELSKRVAVSSAVAIVSDLVGLAMEERLTSVRYHVIIAWAPQIPWYAYTMVVMLAIAGGAGPMLAVDAGLFGENDCLKNR